MDEFFYWIPRDIADRHSELGIAQWLFKFHSDYEPDRSEADALRNMGDASDFYGDDVPIVLFKMTLEVDNSVSANNNYDFSIND